MPEHVVMLMLVIVVGWAVFRWGDLILLAHALFYFVTEQWSFAVLALIYALLLTAIKAALMWALRLSDGYRGAWI